jgi:hypothetical protein
MSNPPVFILSQYTPSGTAINPSGVRHLDITASGFIKNLGNGAGQFLDYGSINISNGKQSTVTHAIVGRVGDFNDATEAVFNLKLFLSDVSDWTDGTFSFNGLPSGQWIPGITLTDTSGSLVPTQVPSGQNWWRDAGGAFNRNSVSFQEITASGLDSQVTQWFYLSTTVDTDVPVKTYGGNTGRWTYRVNYDYR